MSIPHTHSYTITPLILKNCSINVALNLIQSWFSPPDLIVVTVMRCASFDTRTWNCHILMLWMHLLSLMQGFMSQSNKYRGSDSTSSHNFLFLHFQMHHKVITNICRLSWDNNLINWRKKAIDKTISYFQFIMDKIPQSRFNSYLLHLIASKKHMAIIFIRSLAMNTSICALNSSSAKSFPLWGGNLVLRTTWTLGLFEEFSCSIFQLLETLRSRLSIKFFMI